MSEHTIIPSVTNPDYHYELEHPDKHGSLVWIVQVANEPDPGGRVYRSNPPDGYSPPDAGEIGLALALRYAEPATCNLRVSLVRGHDQRPEWVEIIQVAAGIRISLQCAEARALALTILRRLAAVEVQP